MRDEPIASATASLANPTSVREGETLADYRLERRLGAGTTGTVFLARNLVDDAVCAIKILHPHLVTDATARARFAREARAFQLVRHPHVARILDVVDLPSTLAIVLEPYEGVSLRAYLDEQAKVPEELLIEWLSQIVAALGALHDAGWIHRDVKPENLFLADVAAGRREVRLLDFGLVRPLDAWTPNEAPTAAGAFVGSPAYSAPEQIIGEDVGPFTDFWALGVVAYECLTGCRPFVGATRTTAASAVLATPTPPFVTERPGLRVLIDDLLQKDAAHRPADWRTVLASLRRASA
jgi:eukaryotic-like serine/threonine-protein kinase